MSRPTHGSIIKRSGCINCHDGAPHWFGEDSRKKARDHSDNTGHEAWYEEIKSVIWGRPKELEKK